MKLSTKFLFAMVTLMAFVLLGLAGPVVAQDLTDDETCLECHSDTDRTEPADPSVPQIHNPAGGFFAEAHGMWSCVDCHDGITEIPHAEDVSEQAVDCLNCHEEVPSN